jgi:hypothetical protein
MFSYFLHTPPTHAILAPSSSREPWSGPGIRGGGGAGSVALRWRGWVMTPPVRALTETSGNGRVLRRGKNAGGARATGPRTKL